MRKSTVVWGRKWYDGMVQFRRYRWSKGDQKLLEREMEDDRQERIRANLMMAEYAFTQAQDWVYKLDPKDPKNWIEFVAGRVRSHAVRIWLREFWTEEEGIPIKPPDLLYLKQCKPFVGVKE